MHIKAYLILKFTCYFFCSGCICCYFSLICDFLKGKVDYLAPPPFNLNLNYSYYLTPCDPKTYH